MPPRALYPLACACACLLLAACSADNPQSPLPVTPVPSGSTALAPRVFTLRPDQLPGYTLASDTTVTSGSFADQEQDQSLRGRLDSLGFVSGARATYGVPSGATLPFNQVISQSLVFRDAAGATAFFSIEQGRRSVKPDSGSIVPLAGTPQDGVDQVFALDATLPADDSNPQGVSAFLLLARHGRVIVELLGGGDITTATATLFLGLVRLQEQQVAQSPQV